MKLSVNLIGEGRYFRAGENVPDDQVSPAIARFAVTETDSQPERTELCPPSEEHAKPQSSKARRTSKQ